MFNGMGPSELGAGQRVAGVGVFQFGRIIRIIHDALGNAAFDERDLLARNAFEIKRDAVPKRVGKIIAHVTFSPTIFSPMCPLMNEDPSSKDCAPNPIQER